MTDNLAAQLAAMTAERDAQAELALTVHASFEFELQKRLELEAKLAAGEAHSAYLAKSLVKALGERDALVTLVEEIDGATLEPDDLTGWNPWNVLRDIHAMCQRVLGK